MNKNTMTTLISSAIADRVEPNSRMSQRLFSSLKAGAGTSTVNEETIKKFENEYLRQGPKN